MKKRNKLLLSVCVLFLTLVIYKLDGIAFRVHRLKNYIRQDFILRQLHKPEADLSGLKNLIANGDEWFSKYHFISHNGGIIQGRLHSNSLEAWELSYKRGNRIIDADLEFTADDIPVLRHTWADRLEQGHEPERMNYKDFISAKIFRKYTPMSLNDMITFMKSHDDLYVALDSKQDVIKTYSALVKTAQDMDSPEILERIIVSLYDMKDVERVKNIYPFKSENFALRQYGFNHNWYKLAEFCIKNNIHVVNIFADVINSDPEGVKILTSHKIHVYAAVINSLEQLKNYKQLGITGAVSDFLSEPDYSLIE